MPNALVAKLLGHDQTAPRHSICCLQPLRWRVSLHPYPPGASRAFRTLPGSPTTAQQPSEFRIIQQDEQNIQQNEHSVQNYQQQQEQYRNQDRQNMMPRGSETPNVETPFGH
ncbi:hypothetical protein C7I85_22750 [Mesorhizobium soli]|uniref:Uncharacterized protein n=1 Tax=Pseudaminobacter soli (ex Li et al. 2025) TaxID=1295366 RepID=A0A2P7S4L0_9HYPH|nr:hypothetical protein C7I85_22750 [Mesorhizobium soli]